MTVKQQDVTAISHLDLDRYLGTWFEICRLPLKWEDAEARDITATYSLQENGAVRIDNRCIGKDGKAEQAVGEARATDTSNARLAVSFLPSFLRWIPFTKGDYWVLRVSPDYQVALVGTPDRTNLWLLARTPQLSPDLKAEFLATARAQGYDLSGLIVPQQSGQMVRDAALMGRA